MFTVITARRALVWAMLAALAFRLPGEGACADETTEGVRRPNLLFILTDDQRADTVAALGNTQIATPNLDRLVERGFVFRNAYCLGSNLPAVCTPSRNMLLSGRTYFRWQGPMAPAEAPNLPAALAAAGYATYHHGKRGNTAPAIQALFEVNRYVDDAADRTSGQPGREIIDAAIDYLRARRDQRPFAMYLALSSPHDPRVAAEEDRQRYAGALPELPKNYLPLHPFDNGDMTVRDEKLAPWPRTREEIQRHLADYYAVIAGIDRQLGRLLAALAECGEAERTIVIFSSDHGLALGSHGLMGKQNVYEHSMKVPLVVAGPGIPRGSSAALVYLHDLFPTICELAGAAVPEGLDGTSLLPVLEGRVESPRATLFLAYGQVQRAIRDRRWKLIRYPAIDRTQLFDLAGDPDERRDLAGDAAHGERIAALRSELETWQKRLGDEQPWTSAEVRDARFVPPEPK